MAGRNYSLRDVVIRDVLIALIVAIVGGVVVGMIVGEGRFAPEPTMTPSAPLDTVAAALVLSTVTPVPTPISPTDTPTSILIPAITGSPDIEPTPTIGPSFGEMSFCLKDELDEAARRCGISRTVFTGPVECVYVSWTYSNVFAGMRFSRRWYWNNQLKFNVENAVWDGVNWKTDGASEYTWLHAIALGQKYFPPGSYRVELDIGDSLEQSGSFTIN